MATPWAWLPAEAATTPLFLSESESEWILLYAPLSLNEPVLCRFSILRCRSMPVSSLSVLDPSSGVLLATRSRTPAASSTSFNVTSAWSLNRVPLEGVPEVPDRVCILRQQRLDRTALPSVGSPTSSSLPTSSATTLEMAAMNESELIPVFAIAMNLLRVSPLELLLGRPRQPARLLQVGVQEQCAVAERAALRQIGRHPAHLPPLRDDPVGLV